MEPYPNKENPHKKYASSVNKWEWDKPHKPGTWNETPTVKVTPTTVDTLFPNFKRWALGFDDLIDTFRQVSATATNATYPPFNLYKDDNTYTLELAVAGFSKEELNITVKELVLTVKGESSEDQGIAVHKGIATRNFKQDFVLAEYMTIKSAQLKDGLLRIIIEQDVPEHKKPKTITIK